MKKKRKGPVVSEENKLAAKLRMDAYWVKRHKQETVLAPIREMLDAVYLAGWRHNKALIINFRVDAQMSPSQAETEIKKLFIDAFNA
jgi:hypothetical protein